jgi:hypothetical protein
VFYGRIWNIVGKYSILCCDTRADFSPAVVFKMVATMCERGNSTATNAMKTEVHLEPVVDSEEDTV